MQEGRNRWSGYLEQLMLLREEPRTSLTVMEARETAEPNLSLRAVTGSCCLGLEENVFLKVLGNNFLLSSLRQCQHNSPLLTLKLLLQWSFGVPYLSEDSKC